MGKDQELLEAARNGNIAVVEKILGQRAKRSGPLASLRRGPGANVQDSSGYTSLHHASLNGHKEIVRLLLDHDASTNIIDSKGSTPLHLASWSGNFDIVRLLLCGPSICNVNLMTKANETALHSAAQYGHTPVVSLLLEHGCDPGIRNNRGETALDLAAQYGRLETVELLVRTYPGLIQPMQRPLPGAVYPHTSLHLASRNGHKAVVEVLLRAGFDVNVRTPSGTALHEAALCGKVEVVRTLLEHGADLAIRDSHKFTVMDLLSQFPAQATQEIMSIIKRHVRSWLPQDSDCESISQPFPPVPSTNSDLGSPYENVRSCSRGRSLTTDPSPGTSPHRWDFYRQARSVDGVEDRRTSGTSAMSVRLTRFYKSLPLSKRFTTSSKQLSIMHDSTAAPLEKLTFSFNEKMTLRTFSGSSSSSYKTASDCSRGSDNSVFHTPPAPKSFMDSSGHSEDLHFLSSSREADRTSLSSTTSSTGYSRRPDSGAPFYLPMNNVKGGRSPGSNNKVSPTPPKKPPRRNISGSPTHLHPMSMSIDGVSNNAYEYMFLAHTGARSQSDLNELEQEKRRERLTHGRSVDQYVEMNTVFNIALDEEEERPNKELHRGKSEDLDTRKFNSRLEPVAITQVYENMVIKQQNPKRKLRRNPEVYEEYDFRNRTDSEKASSSLPESKFVSSAFIMIKDDYKDAYNSDEDKPVQMVLHSRNNPLSPTHYQQPPTPDHPPPSAMQAENVIYERVRPLSQEYKRKSRHMETEIEEEYLIICDESSESFSSSVSLSDKSVDNVLEEYQLDAPFAGLYRGSAKDGSGGNKPAERPKTLKKLKNIYDSAVESGGKIDLKSSSCSEKEVCNKDNKDRVTSLSPFDEQEEWAKIQEIMASFGTGIVRESVFVSELEKEFQTRLMSLSVSQNNLNPATVNTIDQWLQNLDMNDYLGLFISNGFDDLNFLNGVLEENDLKEMGIVSELERQLILDSCKQLPLKIHDDIFCNNNNNNVESDIDGVEQWLRKIRLNQYAETFAKHLYHDMDRIKRIWDVELSAVLEIEKIGHRKRILASVSSGEHIIPGPKLEDLNTDINTLQSNIQSLKAEIRSPSAHAAKDNNVGTGTGTLRHRHKKSRPAPPPPINISKKEELVKKPAEFFVGGNNSIKAQWRHQPILLITGAVKYTANYLGSTSIKEFKGTESTKKSISKVRNSTEQSSEQDITLSISYSGVKFINPVTKELICEHEIKNVNCACQDTECFTYFAYITKDNNNYYCHVFSTDTADHATDIILTLGQAFELAYQMALREQVTSKTKSNRENHKAAVSPGSVSSHSREFKDSSKADLKLNGHPLKMKPLTLSLAAEPIIDNNKQRTPTKINSGDIQA